jgi:hypothetical protein
MKKFPVTVIDNFYDNPDLVRNIALSLEYSPSEDGRWPGVRTENLNIVAEKLFNQFSAKLFSLFFDLKKTDVDGSIETSFQKIRPFSPDKEDIKNSGWIHGDSSVFSGVIYLNPDDSLHSGTSIYTLKSGEKSNYSQITKCLHYLGKDFDEEEYTIEKNNNNGGFRETIRIENVYNRLVLFEHMVPHGVPTYYTESDQPRLTQTFFVTELTSSTMFPIIRSKIAGNQY